MGKRGPKATPTAVLKLRGTKIGQFNRKGEVQPDGNAVMPGRVHADDLAAACWREYAPLLTAVNCAKRVDSGALENFCLTWARWARAIDDIKDNGEVATRISSTGDAYEVIRPIVRIEATLSSQLNKMRGEFGMTPAARAGLNVQPPTTDDLAEDMVG
jgi:P27 family predicted phage terminase small subunit